MSNSSLFEPLIGLCPFDAKKGHGSFITFSLSSSSESLQEAYFVWIYMCTWSLKHQGNLVHSESTDDEIQKAIDRLTNKPIKAITLDTIIDDSGSHTAARFYFEDDFTLKLFRYDENKYDDEPLFMVRTSDRSWISYLSSGSITNEVEQGAAANP